MDVVMLPLVLPDTEISTALKDLRKRERGGVVMQNTDDTYTLFYVADVLRARDSNARTMSQVEGGKAVLLLDAQRAASFNVDLVRPLRTRFEYEQMLPASNAEYALAGESSDTAMIVTLHEGQTEDLSTGGYECTGTPIHYFPEPKVAVGHDCPKLTHTGTGGARPTIRPAMY